MFHAPQSEYYEEFIELYNTSGSQWADLSGYQIGDQLEQDSLLDRGHGFMLAPHGYALILDPGYWGHSAIYDSLMDQDALVLTIDDASFGAFGLRNDPPDTVILLGPNGIWLASYTYTSPNPSGYSEEKVRLDWGDSTSNWANSLTYLGTPGYVNSVQPADLDLGIVSLSATPSPLPFGFPVTLIARIANLGMQPLLGGEVAFVLGDLENAVVDSILGSADFPTLAPADCTDAYITVQGLPPGPHRVSAYHSLSDSHPENDSLSTLLPGGYPEKSLIINEFLAHPAEDQGEWVEIYNPGPSDVNLLGFSLSDEDTAHRQTLLDSSLMLSASGFALLAEDSTIFDWALPEGLPVLILGADWPHLNDDGDTPTLLDAAGTIQDAVPYTGWEIPAGSSLERIYPGAASNDPANWQPSLDSLGGTPGRANSYQSPIQPQPSSGALAFTPDPFDPDRQGALQITIILPNNATAAAVIAFDLRGRKLKVIFDDEAPAGQQQILWDGRDSDNRRLPPGLYLLFAEFRDSSGNRKSTCKKTLVIAGKL